MWPRESSPSREKGRQSFTPKPLAELLVIGQRLPHAGNRGFQADLFFDEVTHDMQRFCCVSGWVAPAINATVLLPVIGNVHIPDFRALPLEQRAMRTAVKHLKTRFILLRSTCRESPDTFSPAGCASTDVHRGHVDIESKGAGFAFPPDPADEPSDA